jgi:hypothetical protein
MAGWHAWVRALGGPPGVMGEGEVKVVGQQVWGALAEKGTAHRALGGPL